MRDTPPAVDAKYRAMLLERSGEERLKMAGSMYATARALVIASVLEADPSASPAALRRKASVAVVYSDRRRGGRFPENRVRPGTPRT